MYHNAALLSSFLATPTQSRVVEDLQYVYQAASDVYGGNVTVGYPYSLLEWYAAPHTSWSPPLDVRRISSQQTAQDVGGEQIPALAAARQACLGALDMVAADRKSGNGHFLSRESGLWGASWPVYAPTGLLHRPAEPIPDKRGRPPTDGERVGVKEEQTWDEPDAIQECQDEHDGKVCLKRWNG